MGKFSLKPVPPDETGPPPSLASKLLWFAGLGISGVVCVAAVAYILRGLLFI